MDTAGGGRASRAGASLDELRRGAESVRSRAAHLPEMERLMVEELMVEGRTLKDLALLMRMRPWEVRRRLGRLVSRMASAEFVFVASRLGRMSGVRRRVAMACVLHGQSMRRAAEELRLPMHTVRRHAEMVRAMAQGLMG